MQPGTWNVEPQPKVGVIASPKIVLLPYSSSPYGGPSTPLWVLSLSKEGKTEVGVTGIYPCDLSTEAQRAKVEAIPVTIKAMFF